MSEWTLEKALNLAVSMEEDSIKLYSSARNNVVNPGSRILKELVEEEKWHKSNLLQTKEDPGKIQEIGTLATVVQDLRIVDYLEGTSLNPEVDYQDILIYAIKREKATHDFIEMAKRYRESQIGEMFANLAQEELMHKDRLEAEYDDVVQKWM